MKIHLCEISFLIFSIITLNAFSQQNSDEISKAFGDKGEVYFKFTIYSPEEIHNLTKIVSIDHKTVGKHVFAYANKKEFEQFLKLNIQYELLPHPGSLTNPKMKDEVDISTLNEWDFYPTYEGYVSMMYQFEQAFPELCDVFSIGTTVEGRQLLIAKLSLNVIEEETEPRFLYTATIHGDETAGYVLMLRLIEHLLKSYGTDEQVTNILKNMEIWINPLANPDGTFAGGNETVNGATRYNANNIDLNRNFPDPQDGPHPDGNDWQKETIEFMELADSMQFVMAANFHGGYEVFNYPWDTWSQLHPDTDWWRLTGREWADTVHAHAPEGYFTKEENGITNGYDWYEVDGGRQDYMNYFHHCREVTVELSDVKLLPDDLLPDFWEYNYRSFINFMSQGLYGLYGTISDSLSGLPVKGMVLINNHDEDGSYVLSDSLTGGYFRPIIEGNYSVTYSAPKYAALTIDNIEIHNFQRTEQNVKLVYTGAGTDENIYSSWFAFGPNPVNGTLNLSYLSNETIPCEIRLSDATGKFILIKPFTFSSDNRSLAINTDSLANGFYLVHISSGKFEVVKKVIIR